MLATRSPGSVAVFSKCVVCPLEFWIWIPWTLELDLENYSPSLLRQRPFNDFRFPFVEQRPVDRAGPEVRHMLIAVESINRFLQQSLFFAERWPVARKQPFNVARLDSFQ